MPKATEALCYFCNGDITNIDHFALDEEGELVFMCDHCYNLAKKFFDKEVKS